jgi:hypothetical protein
MADNKNLLDLTKQSGLFKFNDLTGAKPEPQPAPQPKK